MTRIETSILKTTAYADLFDYPLTKSELWRFFIGRTVSYSQFQATLVSLIKKRWLVEAEGFIVLPGRLGLTKERKKRAYASIQKLAIAKKAAYWLAFIPFVYYIGVSGSLAGNNARVEDDIDFFVLTAPQTLWLTRFLCIVVLEVLGKRRRPGQTYVKDAVCLNMFFDSSAMRIGKSKHDLYTAHEIGQLKTLVNKQMTFERFVYQNRWLVQFLPHAMIVKKPPRLPQRPVSRIIVMLESWLRQLQIWYMARRKTDEVVGQSVIRLHPHDARVWVMGAYREKLKQLNFKKASISS